MSYLRWIVAILALGWLGQFPLAMLVPHLIMERLYSKAGETMSYNTLHVRAKPDENFRTIVRPSPDLLYALCIYDLDEGPITIRAEVPERYWSMQFYQMDTSNFAGLTNQREQRFRIGTQVNVTLVGPNSNVRSQAGEVIQSPTSRGVMLLRVSAIGDDENAAAALANSSCEVEV